MSPLQIKLAIYALIAIIVIGAIGGFAYHHQKIGEERERTKTAKRDAKTAKDSAELMATEKAKVEQSNNEHNERLMNAITIYADRNVSVHDDVSNLTKRMRQSATAASCSKNPMPGTSNDNQERERRDNEADYDIASAAIKLANLCEKKISELKVIN